MTESDCTAIDVYLRRIETQFSNDSERLCGESLVQFDQIDILQSQPSQSQRLGYRFHRTNSHDFGRNACRSIRNETAERFYTEFDCPGFGHHQYSGCAIT